MKVLLLFPMADGQTGPAIKYAFKKLGHEVRTFDAKLDGRNYCLQLNMLGFKPDLVFCSRTYTLTEQVAEIKKKFKEAKICCWNVDTRDSIQEWEYLFPLIKFCDYYFVVASNLIPDWQKINPNTFWLPQGLQDEVYHKPKEITDEDKEKYECDISFAGSCTHYHAWRVPYLTAIDKMNVDFKVWGCGGSPLIYNDEHNKMVACSKINLGMSGWPHNEFYVSVRDYKILGAGGFLLELIRPGLFDLFPIGGISAYETPKDLITMIKIFLEEDKARKIIAKDGHDFVHEKATYTHRIQRALEIMGLK